MGSFSETGTFKTTSLAEGVNLFPTNTTANSATIRTRVLYTGGEDVSVKFFWGDNNASQVASNWDNNQLLPGTHGLGIQQHSISGLSSGLTYYYTSQFTNSAGVSWAPVRSFVATNNDPPDDIVSGGSLTMPENLSIGGVIVDFNATDPDAGSTVTFTLSDENGSTQNHLFTLDSNGTLRTAALFDFETNASTYQVRIRATDQYSAFREETFSITLTDMDEAPVLTSFDGGAAYTLNIFENRSLVGRVVAQDPESGALTYSISGGADQSFFEINATTGLLKFIQAPDFELPQDNGGNNTYVVGVQASDGVNSVIQTLTVSITNLNEPPIVEIESVSSITGTSATIEGNLTSFSGGTQPSIVLLYDDDTTYQIPRSVSSHPFGSGPRLALWLDANDSSTITHQDGNVSAWMDKSGNFLNLLQDTNASKPKTGVDSHNGLNLLSFDGNDFLQRTTSNILNRNLTCFLVARVDSGGIDNNQDALISYGNVGNGKWELRSLSTSVFNSKLAKNSTWMPTVNYSTPLDTLHLFSIDFDINSSTSSMWVNGTLVNASVPDPMGLAEKQKITIMGNRANPPKTIGGKMGEVIFLRTIDSTLRHKIEGYLAHRWGINNSLPFTHPHRYIRPKAKVPLTSVNLGNKPVGAFTHTLTGLTPGTQYHFRFKSSNPSGMGYSVTNTFSTIGLPVFSNLSSSFSTSTSTALSANLSSTGGEDPIVRFYWGDNDGGTNSSAWDHAYSFSGSQSAGGLTHSISGLLPSTQYYFRSWAQNQAGATYSTPYAFSTTPNNPPSALTVNGTLSIQENQTVGTVVGEFNATDQDAGASFSYALVNGVGDSGNQYFSLDSNGTLRSATIFDFETNSTTQPIRVRVTDEHNGTFESTFNVTITDDGLHDGAAEVFTVSGGQGASPFYTFTDGNGQTRILIPLNSLGVQPTCLLTEVFPGAIPL